MDNLRSALVQNIFQIEANIPADAIEDLKWKYEKKGGKTSYGWFHASLCSCWKSFMLDSYLIFILGLNLKIWWWKTDTEKSIAL